MISKNLHSTTKPLIFSALDPDNSIDCPIALITLKTNATFISNAVHSFNVSLKHSI